MRICPHAIAFFICNNPIVEGNEFTFRPQNPIYLHSPKASSSGGLLLQKYQDALLANIRQQSEIWFDTYTSIPHEEVERFLHSVKGTSGTIGMMDLFEVAGELLDIVQRSTDNEWSPDRLRSFLIKLITKCYEIQREHEHMHPDFDMPAADKPDDQPLILILDDDAALLRYLKEELEAKGYYVIATVNPAQAIHYFHDRAPDCLILDIFIPQQNGFDVMDILKDQIRMRYIPTTVISADTERATRLKAIRMGADDFLNKPIDIEELLVRIERQLARKKQLDQLVFIDELTGALNRKFLAEAYRILCQDSQRTGENFSIAVIDLDRFKSINDSYGHLVGDKVLSGFAGFLKRHVRANDTLIRLGGEEFVLLLPRTHELEAQSLLERIGTEFSQIDFAEGRGLHVTFSAGIIEISDPDRLGSKNGWKMPIVLYIAPKSGGGIGLKRSARTSNRRRRLGSSGSPSSTTTRSCAPC
ncbi:diguanylate cyclase [Cohnella cholangitidis]|uniref:Diguanylate cyclase n=1 Tax=Cohnella cholangitidis TaxID=2598458 RepID=A0A7G5C033_9BACL|nr:diguanylate cyclase [Cohnella cholangitidis]